MKREGVQNKR